MVAGNRRICKFMSNSVNDREIGPDIIRVFAIICVICGHFFSVNTPFNQACQAGGSMLMQGCLKSFFCNLGVPLFLMLTGYFNCFKKITISYYKNIAKVLVPYFSISFVTWIVLSKSHSVMELILGTLGFKIIGYAWYVEMFIGLYLIIPFLNIVLEHVFNAGDKRIMYAMFAILVCMTSLPALVNRGDYRLVPNYWTSSFPVLIYAIGAYIRVYKPIIKRKILATIVICIIYFQYPILNYCGNVFFSVGANLPNILGPYYAVPGCLAMTLLFILIYQYKLSNITLRRFVTRISLVSYEMYLFSYLCDRIIYPYFMEHYYINQSSFLIWFVPITLVVLVSSYMLSAVYKHFITIFKKTK